MNMITKWKSKTILKSELEMFNELEKTDKKIKSWNIKFSNIDKLYSKNSEYIKNLSL